jgi:hypothetical protein
MPLAPQITNTPVDITVKDFAISAVSYTSSTATYTATGHTFAAGDTVIVSGLVPDGYNGTFTIASIATNTFTVANTTNAAVTTATGDAYSADNTDYDQSDTDIVYIPNNEDVTDLINNNAIVAQAQAQADLAVANAAIAQTAAGNAQTTADGKNRIYRQGTAPSGTLVIGDIWFDTSTGNKPYTWTGSAWISVQDASITTALNTANAAQSTADGKNKITYSNSAPGSTANKAGDIWWQYGTGGVISGQWTGAGGTSWTPSTIGSTVIANLDAGKITAGTISVAISLSAATITGGSIDIGSGTFKVTSSGAVTITSGSININSSTFILSSAGKLTCSDVVITGGTLTIGTKFSVDNTGILTSTAGNIGGFTIDSTGFSSPSYSWSLSSNGTLSGGNSNTLYYGYVNIGGGTNYGSSRLYVTGDSSFIGAQITTGNITGQSNIYYPYHPTTGSSANAYINASSGLIARSTSSLKYKVDVQDQIIPLESILALEPKSYFDKGEADAQGSTEGLHRILGVIAEEVANIPVLGDLLMNRDKDGNPDSINYDRIAVALIPLLKNLNDRVKQLEGK